MSYLLSPHSIRLLRIAKTAYQQKERQNLTSLIPKFTLQADRTLLHTTSTSHKTTPSSDPIYSPKMRFYDAHVLLTHCSQDDGGGPVARRFRPAPSSRHR